MSQNLPALLWNLILLYRFVSFLLEMDAGGCWWNVSVWYLPNNNFNCLPEFEMEGIFASASFTCSSSSCCRVNSKLLVYASLRRNIWVSLHKREREKRVGGERRERELRESGKDYLVLTVKWSVQLYTTGYMYRLAQCGVKSVIS